MRRVVIVVVGCWMGLVAPARPQAVSTLPVWLDMDLVLARPLGELKRHVGDAWGINGSIGVRFGQRRALGLRAEVSALEYGEEITPLEPCAYCFLIFVTGAEVVTRQKILSIGVGPELTVPIGRVRLGFAPQVGISTSTTSAATRAFFLGILPSDDEPAGHTSATAFWYGGGADVTVPLERRPAVLALSAHAGVRYQHNGRVRYQTASEVTVNADGSVSFLPVRREANLVQLRVGLSVEIPTSGPDRPHGSRRRRPSR